MASILTDRNPVLSTRRRAVFRMRASASLSLGRPRMGFRSLAELGMSSHLSQLLYLYATLCIEYMPGNPRATRCMTTGHKLGASSELRKAVYTLWLTCLILSRFGILGLQTAYLFRLCPSAKSPLLIR